jgi:hypothetical protein
MDKYYFNTQKVIYKFVVMACTVLIFWLIVFSRIKTVSGYTWFCFAFIIGTYIVYLSGRYVIAVINKKPALIITDEYVHVYQATNTLALYTNAKFYWEDIAFFRQYHAGNKNNIEFGFFKAIKANGSFKDLNQWLSRKRTITFNIDIIDGHITEIMDALEKYCLINEEKQPSV